MKRRFLSTAALGAAALVVAGCAQKGPPPLYSWQAFPRHQYETLLRSGVNPQEQLDALQAHADDARARGAALPPGLRAHMGLLHLALGRGDQARDHWLAEKAAFPESSPYIDQLLKRLEADRPNGPVAGKGGST